MPKGIFEIQPARQRVKGVYKCLEEVAIQEKLRGFFKAAHQKYEG